MSDFWTRRRAAVARADEVHRSEAAEIARAARDDELAERPEADVLSELGLPAPETLTAADDFAAFLRDGVPAWLKARALRRLWRVKPGLANLDGLLDYGEDFTDAARASKAVATAYQVGRGMTRHVEELARRARLADAADAAVGTEPMTEASAPAFDAIVDRDAASAAADAPPDGPEDGPHDEPDDGPDHGVDGAIADPLAHRPRMAFRFEAEA